MTVLARNNVRLSGAEAGQPVVFSHGFGCDQNIWRYVAPAFEPEYRVVLFDHVGSGRSDLSAYDSAKYASLRGYARDVLEICRELDLPRIVFVGHSVSAMIGALAAIEEPDRFDKLVLLAPSPRYLNDRDYVGGFSRQDIDALLESLESNYLGWAEQIAPVIVGNLGRPELGEELKESLCRMDPTIALEFARVTFLSDNRTDLTNVQTRSLVLQCSEDKIAPQQVGEYVHDQLRDSELVVMQATGHCPHLSGPEETVAAIKAFASSVPVVAPTLASEVVPTESAEELYENAPCGYLSTRVDGEIVKVNETFLRWTGFQRRDLVGQKRIHDLLAVGDRIYYETRSAPLLQLQGAAREIAAHVLRADGERLPVLLSSVLVDTPGHSPLVRTTVFDATDRRRYERELLRGRREAERLSSELRSERQRLRQILERMHEGVVTVDGDLTIRFANDAVRRIPGLEDLETSEPLPDPWPNLGLRKVVTELFVEGAYEAHADFAPTPSTTYSVVGLPAGPTEEAVLVFTDLSAISRREQAEREFVANAAHELRTPVTAITSAIEVLQAGAKEIPEDREVFLTDIEREAARLRRLTRALLLLAEVQAQKRRPAVAEVNVRGLLEDAATGMHVNDAVIVEVVCDPGLKVVSNADLAAQALEGVAANAAKFTLSGRISLSGSGDEGGATIVVADSGPGLSPEAEGRAFDRFYKDRERRGDGFGLGLSIASQAIESLGGELEVRRAAPEGGTIVRLRLPTLR